jgi:hypothetical protein
MRRYFIIYNIFNNYYTQVFLQITTVLKWSNNNLSGAESGCGELNPVPHRPERCVLPMHHTPNLIILLFLC